MSLGMLKAKDMSSRTASLVTSVCDVVNMHVIGRDGCVAVRIFEISDPTIQNCQILS